MTNHEKTFTRSDHPRVSRGPDPRVDDRDGSMLTRIQRLRDAITAIKELDGPMPAEMRDLVLADVSGALRGAVRATKREALQAVNAVFTIPDVAEIEPRLIFDKLQWVKRFIAYARYELQPGEATIGSQFPHQADADKAMLLIDEVIVALYAGSAPPSLSEASASAGRSGAPESGWQSISTAPKDGTPVLVLTLFPKGVGAQKPQPVAADFSHGLWCTRPGRYNVQPTHWMPLPDPPSEET